jgi:hypothetical protein
MKSNAIRLTKPSVIAVRRCDVGRDGVCPRTVVVLKAIPPDTRVYLRVAVHE